MLYEGAALKNKTEHLRFDVDTSFVKGEALFFIVAVAVFFHLDYSFFIKEQFHGKMVSHYSRLVADFLGQSRFCIKSELLSDHSSTFRHSN